MSDFKRMTDLKEINKQSYDFAIIGSQLHALLIAYTLSRVYHKKVAILEPSEIIGGEDASIIVGAQKLMSHYMRIPSLTNTPELLEWLNQSFDIETPCEAVEITPIGIDSGKLIPFVGFGDRKFTTIDLLNNYVQGEGYELNQMPSQWVEQLKNLFIGDIYTMAEVTALHTENNRLQYVVINGDKNLIAEQYIYCLPLKNLKKIASPQILTHKSLQKVFKNKTFSCLRLHLVHDNEALVEKKPFHVLYGAKEEFEPVIGQFSEINQKLHSLWSCWILSDLIDDNEHLGAVLKHIKKQIKRAYPQLFEHVEYEKIVFEQDCEGSGSLADLMTQNFCKLDGFWVCHPQIIDKTGLIGKIQAAKITCDGLQQSLGLLHEEYVVTQPEPVESSSHL